MHLALLDTESWATQLLTQGTLSQWFDGVQYELGFQFSYTLSSFGPIWIESKYRVPVQSLYFYLVGSKKIQALQSLAP